MDEDGLELRPVLVNGAAGMLLVRRGRPFTLFSFTVSGGRIVGLAVYGDNERLARLVGRSPHPAG